MSGARAAEAARIRSVNADMDGNGRTDRPLDINLTASFGGFGGTDATVMGHGLVLAPVESRYATEGELDSAPSFSYCEMGAVLYVLWSNNLVRRVELSCVVLRFTLLEPLHSTAAPNLCAVIPSCPLISPQGESWSRVGSLMEGLRNRGAFPTRGARFAVATPQKLPLETFNEWCGCGFLTPGPRRVICFGRLRCDRRLTRALLRAPPRSAHDRVSAGTSRLTQPTPCALSPSSQPYRLNR